jgi:hypothetical protein
MRQVHVLLEVDACRKHDGALGAHLHRLVQLLRAGVNDLKDINTKEFLKYT